MSNMNSEEPTKAWAPRSSQTRSSVDAPVSPVVGAQTTMADLKYQVFLSHNWDDKAAVEELAHRLRQREGIEPWLDKWHLIPGAAWQPAIEQALAECGSCAVFIG